MAYIAVYPSPDRPKYSVVIDGTQHFWRGLVYDMRCGGFPSQQQAFYTEDLEEGKAIAKSFLMSLLKAEHLPEVPLIWREFDYK